jgi:hypothetical protein
MSTIDRSSVSGRRVPAAAALAIGATLLLPAAAGAAGTQQRLSETASGAGMNGVATEPTISWDSRINRFVGFTSTSTSVGRVEPGRRNVFLVRRTGQATRTGNAWQASTPTLVSVGRDGSAANGDSWGMSISGATGRADAPVGPTRLAFLSTASNLTKGGTSTASVYVRSVNGGAIRRISAPGAANGVDVSGDGKTIWITTSKGLYRSTGGTARRIKGGSGFTSPSTNARGNEVTYARRGTIYLRTSRGSTRRIGRGSSPMADDGANTKKIRAVAFVRGGTAYRAVVGGRTASFGRTGTDAAINAGASTLGFGQGSNVRLQVKVISSGKDGGYARPQGSCPAGQGSVTGVAVSTRYNYVAFTCGGGGLYLYYVGAK